MQLVASHRESATSAHRLQCNPTSNIQATTMKDSILFCFVRTTNFKSHAQPTPPAAVADPGATDCQLFFQDKTRLGILLEAAFSTGARIRFCLDSPHCSMWQLFFTKQDPLKILIHPAPPNSNFAGSKSSNFKQILNLDPSNGIEMRSLVIQN